MTTPEAAAVEVDAYGPLPPIAPDALLCIGHSHVNCVAEAALAQGMLNLQALNFWALPGAIEHKVAGEVVLGRDIIRRLERHPGKVFSFIGGSAHTVLGMLVHPRRFDFVLPEAPDLPFDPAAEVVPAQALTHVLERETAPYLAVMEQVRRHSRSGMLHVEPPPPSADAVRLLGNVPWSLYPPDMRHEISPWLLRWKLWRLHSRIVREWCGANGVEFIPCPATALDVRGGLADECFGDGPHANVAYGRQVLAQILERA